MSNFGWKKGQKKAQKNLIFCLQKGVLCGKRDISKLQIKIKEKMKKILNLATKKQTPFFSVCHLINCVDSYKLVKDFPLI